MSASFIYPPNGNFSDLNNEGPINTFDTLFIEYSSSWAALNLTLFCDHEDDHYDFYNIPQNPISGSGTIGFGAIEDSPLRTIQYPASCHFHIAQYGHNEDVLPGEHFQVSSQPASSTTYSPSSTTISISSSTTTPLVQSTVASAQTTFTPTQATFMPTQATITLSPTNAAATTGISGASTGLSAGAGAGIGVGAAATVFVLATIGFILFRRRQQERNTSGAHHNGANNTYSGEKMGAAYFGNKAKDFPMVELQTAPVGMIGSGRPAELYGTHASREVL